MNQILLECAFNSDKEDRAYKNFDKSKNYFVKSFLMQVFGAFAPSTTATSCIGGVWRGLVPPRVEVLTWMMLLSKPNTKDHFRTFKSIMKSYVHFVMRIWKLLTICSTIATLFGRFGVQSLTGEILIGATVKVLNNYLRLGLMLT